jgi:hypothetical protein
MVLGSNIVKIIFKKMQNTGEAIHLPFEKSTGKVAAAYIH